MQRKCCCGFVPRIQCTTSRSNSRLDICYTSYRHLHVFDDKRLLTTRKEMVQEASTPREKRTSQSKLAGKRGDSNYAFQ